MLNVQDMLKKLKRPKLLVRAARFGVDDFRRDQHLKRILGSNTLPKSSEALLRLMDAESALEEERKSNETSYSLARHIEVLTAIMFEQRLLSVVGDET